MDIKKSLKDVIVLVVICAVFSSALALVNYKVAPIIADRLAAAADQAYEEVIEGATGFEDVDLTGKTIPSTVQVVKREKSGLGYAIKIVTTGYGSGMTLIIGVNSDGVVTGATCIASNETNGVEKSYGDNFIGKDLGGAKDVDTVAASTMTTKAYREAVVDAINTVTILSGGSADLRSEEEIFFDNLKEALPDAFTADSKVYADVFTETLIVGNDGNIYTNTELHITSINKAINGAGYVFVIDKEMVAVNAEGAIVSEASAEAKTLVEAAVALDCSFTAVEVDITEYRNSEDRNVKRTFNSINYVKVTAAGNYVIETKNSGYGKDPMIILVTISADGKVIDNLTVSNSETPNFGGVQLADGKYNAEFNDKTQADVDENADGVFGVDTISGVTVTTKAYRAAIIRAFTAFDIIEGGAN